MLQTFTTDLYYLDLHKNMYPMLYLKRIKKHIIFINSDSNDMKKKT